MASSCHLPTRKPELRSCQDLRGRFVGQSRGGWDLGPESCMTSLPSLLSYMCKHVSNRHLPTSSGYPVSKCHPSPFVILVITLCPHALCIILGGGALLYPWAVCGARKKKVISRSCVETGSMEPWKPLSAHWEPTSVPLSPLEACVQSIWWPLGLLANTPPTSM